jgi:hypothetical protein
VLVVGLELLIPGGAFSAQTARLFVTFFAGIAIVSAAFTIFVVPVIFRYFDGASTLRLGGNPGVFVEAIRSDDVQERALGRLGLLSIAQMLAAAVPSFIGFAAFLVGAHVSAFMVFVALSIVVLAAVYPRESEWDGAIERLADRGFGHALKGERA